MSEWQIATASSVTSTSPASGARRDTSSMVSGAPKLWQTAALMGLMNFSVIFSQQTGIRPRPQARLRHG
jgi:hypothetical protein